eukprot:TRINITY_DN79726_c0_g1_i1.p1 TRINITY_DN79726_c0_g1~~TRINITY_DN79726_c0_g1_i1.p1  ORF type:complete len:351 (+),score=83.97 TRINITY_DN79726_c0_g1_i1:60-1112(+)
MGASCSECSSCSSASAEGAAAAASTPFAAVAVGPAVFHGAERSFGSAFAVGEELGVGGYARVHACRSRKTSRQMACKTFAKGPMTNSEKLAASRSKTESELRASYREALALVAGALREAELMNSWQKEGGCRRLVTLLEVFDDADALHLVLELCPGGDLFSRQKSIGIFSEEEARELLQQMVEAVAFLHSRNVVHRDLKLENWLLRRKAPSLELCLCDFGLALVLEPGAVASEKVGSPYYVAPEVLLGSYDHRADIWGLGVILYMLLDGSPPFNGADHKDILAAVKSGRIQFEQQIWDDVSPEARRLVLLLLTRLPERRLTLAGAEEDRWLFPKGKGFAQRCSKISDGTD